MRLEGARISSTPTAPVVRFCWNSMPRSIVTSASYSPPLRRRSSPFVMPVQPRPRYRYCGLGAQRRGLAATARQEERAPASSVARARSSTAIAWSRLTEGNWRRNSSKVSPPSRYSNSECIGTRVPTNTGVPPRMSGSLCTMALSWVMLVAPVYTRSNRAYNSGMQPTAFGRG